MRILIVDDNSRTRRSLHLLLQTVTAFTEIREASDGLDAVNQVEMQQFDLIVMDGRMPEMDGVEAGRQIKARQPQVRIVLLSMYPEYREFVSPSCADVFVSKGEPPDRLLEILCAYNPNPSP